MAEMKFYIFKEFQNEDGDSEFCPLCWDGPALQFDTYESAQSFLASCLDASFKTEEELEFFDGAEIKECIFYYDAGVLNCENKRVVFNEELQEEVLVDIC